MIASDTIAAAATPPGFGGVGIIRVSGVGASRIAESILGCLPEPRYAHFSAFKGSDGEPIDTGLALFFRAPASFTGEDILELQGHGGPVVLDLLLERTLSLGARLARPGEFSERAFLNGKIDLVQAEAIADLIESADTRAARLASRTLAGVFSQRVAELSEGVVELRVLVEASLDFPDEELDGLHLEEIRGYLARLLAALDALMTEAHQGQLVREGVCVVIAGPPNVGKSSLLNRLTGQNTAIVTHIEGTTRDLMRAEVDLDGLRVQVTDTAGLRATRDEVERIGIDLAKAQVQGADIVLWVEDAADASSFPVSCIDYEVLEQAVANGARVIKVRNKIDLTDEPPGIRSDGAIDGVYLSAVTGAGMAGLTTEIKTACGFQGSGEGNFLARRRHFDALSLARACLIPARVRAERGQELELIAEDLRRTNQALGEITGELTSDDLLGRIFSSFCIGK